MNPEFSSYETALTAGADGYIDAASGLYVFTAAYHLERGYCCANGCRHCPFDEDVS